MSSQNVKLIIPEKERAKIERILIIGSIGIGNLLLFSSTLRRIKLLFPNSKIDVIVLKQSFIPLYQSEDAVNEILVLDVDRTKSIGQKIEFIIKLRRNKYQLCVTTFPANRAEYNVLAFLSGAKWRLAHKYELKRVKSLSFLQNLKIPVDNGKHDLEQNFNLLKVFNTEISDEDKKIYMNIPKEAEIIAEEFIEKNDLKDSLLVGMHPGSSAERGMDLKRWPAEYFAEICSWLKSKYDAEVLLFGGPEELDLRIDIRERSETDPLIVEGLSLLESAGLIRKCSLFLTNDSGLMHISVAMGTKAVSVFGPSDPGRTAPYGKDHKVVRTNIHCSPCWSINNLGVGWIKCIQPDNICLKDLTPDLIKPELEKELGRKIKD
ncbi:glycosyltransferase family 9 protein [candidate division KSB1 bacterium]